MGSKKRLDDKVIKNVGQAAGFLKAVAEENRLKILRVLQAGERCVCDIWKDLNIPQNLASHHLKIRKAAGLVDSRRVGLKMLYSINKKATGRLRSLFNIF